jgi:mRNA interferase RelE/StbE
MAWKIEFDPAALKELRKLDKPVEKRILKFLRERIEKLDDPRQVRSKT